LFNSAKKYFDNPSEFIKEEKNMLKKSIRMLIIPFAFYVLASPCFGGALDAFEGQKGTLKIAGGTAHIPVMKEAAKRIMTSNKNIVITVAGGGSGVGIKQVGEGLVDIGNSGRKPKPEEIERYKLKMYQWAVDGVGVVVNPVNSVKSFTKAQLKDVFAGKIVNWATLGGIDHSITVYTRDEASGTRAVFWQKALDKGDISTKALFVPSNGAMKTAIANDPYAIGYVSVGHMDESVAPVALDSVTPTLETVKNGEYKIARGLYSNTKGEPEGLARLFIEYLFTPEGQQIAADKGFIPVK
jgi:phosphate transport system substrate-binding protein